MAYPIEKKFVPGLPQLAYRKGKPEGVLGHSTATPEADALREWAYFRDNWRSRSAFVHYFVDWERILYTADTKYKCWGAGPTANQRYIQIELCESRNPEKFKESYKRYVWLIAHLLKEGGWDTKLKSGLWTHYDATYTFHDTNHVDPYGYLSSHGVSKDQFVKDVREQYDSMSGKAATVTSPKEETKSTSSSSLLKEGSRGDAVKELQRKLVNLGYNTNGVDGIFGAGTEKAVKAFQKDHKLAVDGLAGKNTMAALDKAQPKYSRLIKLTKPYMKGEDVKAVQRRLGISADGMYGPNSEKAVKDFQRANKLSVDGKVGPNTWGKLF